jgi:hypothetical protein
MKQKQKAEELVDKFDLPSGLISIERIQCALIAVDEILNMSYPSSSFEDLYCHLSYWNEVKKEIEKL